MILQTWLVYTHITRYIRMPDFAKIVCFTRHLWSVNRSDSRRWLHNFDQKMLDRSSPIYANNLNSLFKCRPYYMVEGKRRNYLVLRFGWYSDKNKKYYCVVAFSNASRTSTVPIESTYESTGLPYLKRAAVVQARNVCSARVELTPTGDLVQGLKKKISIIHFFETHPCTLRAFILPPPPPHTPRPPHRHAQRPE